MKLLLTIFTTIMFSYSLNLFANEISAEEYLSTNDESKVNFTIFPGTDSTAEEILAAKKILKKIITKIEGNGFFLNYGEESVVVDDKIKTTYKQFNGIIKVVLSSGVSSEQLFECNFYNAKACKVHIDINNVSELELESFFIRNFYSHENMRSDSSNNGYGSMITSVSYLDLNNRIQKIYKKLVELGFELIKIPAFIFEYSSSVDQCENTKKTDIIHIVGTKEKDGPVVRYVSKQTYGTTIYDCINDELLEKTLIQYFKLP